MLIPAVVVENELQIKYQNKIGNDNFNYLYFQNYTEFSLVIDKNDWNRFQYVSKDKNNILAFFEARIDRNSNIIEDLIIMKFEEKKLDIISFKDFIDFIYLLFEKNNIKKIFFRYISENPSAKLYKKLFFDKIKCGKLIGIMEESKMIRNGNLCDIIIIELIKEIFTNWYETKYKRNKKDKLI